MTHLEWREVQLSNQMQQNLPTVLHVIPGLHTGGAEHRLAALVTAKRKQPFSQIIVDLKGGARG